MFYSAWIVPSSLKYNTHLSRQWSCWTLRCIWSIACRRCSNCIFILHWTLGFNVLCEDNWKPSRETFKFWDLVCFVLEILRYSLLFSRLVLVYWKWNEPRGTSNNNLAQVTLNRRKYEHRAYLFYFSNIKCSCINDWRLEQNICMGVCACT